MAMAAAMRTFTEPAEGGRFVGCPHYKTRSQLVAPCCKKIYTCRFCHDEKEGHQLERKEVMEIICTKCGTRQAVQAVCRKCNFSFGLYSCLKCRIFEDQDRKQFHCDGCGICRVGGRENFFHCRKCNMCLPVMLWNNHTCLEDVSRDSCPICLEDIHTSRVACDVLRCGHLLHGPCHQQLLAAGHGTCPTCQGALPDKKKVK